MLTLEDSGLVAEILDPRVDQAKLGARYCSGGYVWQVSDEASGALLSGPCFPAPNPPPFDGQGLPEVFEIALGQDTAKVGEEVWVVGVGRVRRESPVRPFHVRDNARVVERAAWSVERAAASVTMRSFEAFSDFALELERTVSLRERTLTSATTLRNSGARDVPVRWFAHPFFPWSAGVECFDFSLETTLPENPGFLTNTSGVVERRPGCAWRAGCYVVAKPSLGGALEASVRQPRGRDVRATCRFPLAWLALWGNDRTVSFEPFHATVVAPGATSAWAIDYRF